METEIEQVQSAIKRYVKPHKVKSREVTQEDIERVKEEGKVLLTLCTLPHGIYPGGFAVAHPQIDDKDPLRFYVTKDGEIIINPVITRHTEALVNRREGCLTLPSLGMTVVRRWTKCEMDFQTIVNDGELSKVMHVKLSGRDAEVAQHEIDHFEGVYIFPEEVWANIK